MKRIFTFLSLLIAVQAFAQLSVKPNGTTESFVYVQDQILFVTQDVNLTKNADVDPVTDTIQSSIYLRGEAQLIQGSIGDNANKGDGTISVFQEGSTNQFDYNNWSSPVSVPIDDMGATIGNGNGTFGPSTIYTPFGKTESGLATIRGGYDSVAGNGATDTAIEIPRYWFFYYPSGDDYLGWVHVQDDNYVIPAGYGYTMKGVTGADTHIADDYVGDNRANNTGSAQRYDFRGRPNNGTIPIGATTPITAGHSVFVGNPYPSAIDLSYFLLEHSITTTANVDNDDGTTPEEPITFTGCDDLDLNGGTVTRKNNTTGVAYFWDSRPGVGSHYLTDYEGGYEAFAPVDCATSGMSAPATYFKYDETGTIIAGSDDSVTQDAVSYNRRYAPIAQGFIVETVDTGFENTIAFENRHRIYRQEKNSPGTTFKLNNTSQASGKTSETNNEPEEGYTADGLFIIPKLKLNIEFNDTYTRQLSLGFWENSTANVNYAMDAVNRYVLGTDAGFMHNDNSYVIDVRPFEVTDQIPLFLQVAELADVKFTATSFENFDTENVLIFDSENGNYYNVKHTNWSITLAAGEYHNRFFLVFEEPEVLDINEFAADNFDIFQNNKASQLEIRNPNALDLKAVTVYDITGKQLISAKNLEGQSEYTFSTRNFAEAIYVVRIITSDDIEISQKITVSNRN